MSGQRGVHRDVDEAGRQAGKVDDRPFGPVLRENGDAITGSQASVAQRGMCMLHPTAERRHRHVMPGTVVLESHRGSPVGEPLGGTEEDVVECDWRHSGHRLWAFRPAGSDDGTCSVMLLEAYASRGYRLEREQHHGTAEGANGGLYGTGSRSLERGDHAAN